VGKYTVLDVLMGIWGVLSVVATAAAVRTQPRRPLPSQLDGAAQLCHLKAQRDTRWVYLF